MHIWMDLEIDGHIKSRLYNLIQRFALCERRTWIMTKLKLNSHKPTLHNSLWQSTRAKSFYKACTQLEMALMILSAFLIHFLCFGTFFLVLWELDNPPPIRPRHSLLHEPTNTSGIDPPKLLWEAMKLPRQAWKGEDHNHDHKLRLPQTGQE